MTRPHVLLDPVFTSCPRCPGWQLAVATEAEKQRKEEVHAHAKHGDPMPSQTVVGGAWQERAADAVRQVAARGRAFTLYEALAEFGLADPPNARTALGRFAVLVHDIGIAHVVSYRQSVRKGTKRSATAVWSRDGRRCVDVKCRKRAGV